MTPRDDVSCDSAFSLASSAGCFVPALPLPAPLPRPPLVLHLSGEERGLAKSSNFDQLRQVSHLWSQSFRLQLLLLFLQQHPPLLQRLLLLVGGDEDLFDGEIVLLPDRIGTPSSSP